MESYSTWWEGLSLTLKIFWGLAIPFTIIFLLQLFLSFFGGGDHPDSIPDVDVETDHGVPFQFLTFKNMVGFFTIFAWTGIACIDAGLSNTITLVFATLAGLLMMGMMAGIFYAMSRAGADGTMKIKKAIGLTGEVYLTIPSSRKSMGKVQITIMGSLRTLDALTDDDTEIPTGRIIKVSNVVNESILLVTAK
jgi:hypothetical protein